MQEVPSSIFYTFTHYKIIDGKIKFDHSLNVKDSSIYKHLKVIFCKNNDNTFEYMTHVFSRILKQPIQLLYTFIILWEENTFFLFRIYIYTNIINYIALLR
jgi:hypothetical protein